jgi:hypothetical protein
MGSGAELGAFYRLCFPCLWGSWSVFCTTMQGCPPAWYNAYRERAESLRVEDRDRRSSVRCAGLGPLPKKTLLAFFRRPRGRSFKARSIASRHASAGSSSSERKLPPSLKLKIRVSHGFAAVSRCQPRRDFGHLLGKPAVRVLVGEPVAL